MTDKYKIIENFDLKDNSVDYLVAIDKHGAMGLYINRIGGPVHCCDALQKIRKGKIVYGFKTMDGKELFWDAVFKCHEA